MDFSYLKNILNNLIQRTEYRNLPHVYELKRELHCLNKNEKKIIKNRIKDLQYNIGTFDVIKMLNEENILSISEYLENIKEDFEAMQIITDLFDDSVNSLDLLTEVLASNKFQEQIDESLKNYVQDLIEHPELIKIELLSSTCESLPKNVFQNSILKKSLQHLTHYKNDTDKDFSHVITQQKEWNVQYGEGMLANTFKSIIPSHGEFIVNELISIINQEGINWFYVLMIVNFFNEDGPGYKYIKITITSYFKKFKETNDITSLYKSIILARQLLHYSPVTSTYKAWVKNNIGELKYSLKNAECFTDLLQSLQNLVVYENDCDIIRIHIGCQISAPSKMYSTVLEYKEILKSKDEVLKNKMDVS